MNGLAPGCYTKNGSPNWYPQLSRQYGRNSPEYATSNFVPKSLYYYLVHHHGHLLNTSFCNGRTPLFLLSRLSPLPSPQHLVLQYLKQVAFRAFRCRSSYRALLVKRGRAATILQSAERRKRAFVTAADLREQRISRWEQLWDDESGRFYFYFKVNTRGLFSFRSVRSTCCLSCFPGDDRLYNRVKTHILEQGDFKARPPCGWRRGWIKR